MTTEQEMKIFGRPGRAAPSIVRVAVLALAAMEIAVAVYVLYAVFLDDTTSWIISELLSLTDSDDLWQALVFPLAAAGLAAFLLAAVNRMLWLALALVVGGPIVATWLLL